MTVPWLRVAVVVQAIAIGILLYNLLVYNAVYQGTAADYGEVIAVWKPVSCSGVLMRPEALLTAAHCGDPTGEIPADRDELIGNSVAAISRHWKGGLWQEAAGTISAVHPTRDLAVACLACIPQAEAGSLKLGLLSDVEPVDGANFLAIGYGQTSGPTLWPGVGRSVIRYKQAETFTARAGPSVACPGDSGGPAIAANGRVFGIVEQFAEPNSNCGADMQYARVDLDLVRTWIESAVKACPTPVATCPINLKMPGLRP